MKNIKRIISSILVFAFIASSCIFSAGASGNSEDLWEGTATLDWYSDASTLYIDSAEDLAAFANAVNTGKSFANKTVELACHIIWNEGSASTWSETNRPEKVWTPIGNSAFRFNGTFNGNGYSVSGLYYYGYYSSVIETLTDASVSANSYVGFFAQTSGATIKDLHITNSYFNAFTVVGSIVGASKDGLTLSGCSSDAYLISNNATPSNHHIGGLVGHSSGVTNITNCAYSGNIISDSGCNIAGILGAGTSGPITITNCLATGTYTGYNRVAGIIARNYSDLTVRDCYSNCKLYAWGTANMGGTLGGCRTTSSVILDGNYYNGEFYKGNSALPTRLGCSENNISELLTSASNYYTDSVNDNSYTAQGNQRGLPTSVKRVGGLNEFLLANSSVFGSSANGVYLKTLKYSSTGGGPTHAGACSYSSWSADSETDGQVRRCTLPGCSVVEKRDESINVLGASVRIKAPAGIRFMTKVDKNEFFKKTYNGDYTSYTVDGANITFGTLIIPFDLLDGELTVDTDQVLDIKAENIYSQNNSEIYFTGVIVDYPERTDTYNREMAVRSYIKYDGKYVYSDMVTTSFYEIACQAYEREGQNTKEGLNLLMALGSVNEDFYATDSNRVLILEHATPELFADYAAALSAEGYTCHHNYEYSDNLFGMYYNDDYVISFYYAPKSIGKYVEPNQNWYAYGEPATKRTEDMDKIRDEFGVTIEDTYNVMRIVVEERSRVDLPATAEENAASYSRNPAIVNSISQVLPYNNYGSYGMEYVIQLADGSFIIIDSGKNATSTYNSSENDAKLLYDYLCKMKPASHAKPKIAAWILTHGHDDHVEAFQGFMPKYGNSVELEQVVLNFHRTFKPYSSDASYEPFADSYIDDDTKVIVAHTGYKLYVRNAVVTILYSMDDFANNDRSKVFYNNESIAFDVVIDGKQRLMFTGEIFIPGSRTLVNMYGEDLASDVIQLSHHGHYGATPELYEYIWPASQDYSDENRFALWPIGNEEQRRNRLGLAENLWIFKRIAEDVGITWKAEWDAEIESIMNDPSYIDYPGISGYTGRFWKIGRYLTDDSRLGSMGNALWDKIYSMVDILLEKTGDKVGYQEKTVNPDQLLSNWKDRWEKIDLYTASK